MTLGESEGINRIVSGKEGRAAGFGGEKKSETTPFVAFSERRNRQLLYRLVERGGGVLLTLRPTEKRRKKGL